MDQRISPEANSLSALLQAASQGDRSAFRALYQKSAPKLLGLLLRILRNRSIAEEVLQETYVRIWQNADRFTPEAGQPIAWMATIARNKAIDRLRSERFERHVVPDESILERLAADSPDPAMQETLRTCLDALDEEAREYVVLAYCFGLSREELAERFGRPVGTIKTFLHRSIKLLRTCLQ